MNAWHRFRYRLAVSLRELGERKRKYWVIRLGYWVGGRVW